MIPFFYRLREGIRIDNRSDSCIVVSETPLNVVRASLRAGEILRKCEGGATAGHIARTLGMTEEQVFRICDYFNKKAVLEMEPATNEDYFPPVTVIIPVKDRAGELAGCLQSVIDQDYPPDRLEIIVVDDGSTDTTGQVARSFPCKLLANDRSRGQSFCRNRGAMKAKGEILAFLDSDCVAGRTWIRELVPYFRWERVGAVGGYVDGYYAESSLDLYEKTCSPLNMGRHILYAEGRESTFYVPTCNLLVRKKVYLENGGIAESLHVGEDVDFCWRMRNHGHTLLYVPVGTVQHKHRSSIARMLKRRGDYGTSEALLYGRHREKRKTFQMPPLAATAFLALVLAILLHAVIPLFAVPVCALLETGLKASRTNRTGVHVPLWRILFSVMRSYLSFFYFTSFHIIRYYLLVFVAAGCLAPALWILGLALLFYAALVDYVIKRPRLFFLTFLLYYALEHACYQAGVAAGCLRERTFRPYRSTVKRRLVAGGSFS